jgi:hypothetical protein
MLLFVKIDLRHGAVTERGLQSEICRRRTKNTLQVVQICALVESQTT